MKKKVLHTDKATFLVTVTGPTTLSVFCVTFLAFITGSIVFPWLVNLWFRIFG